jgi:hypothetical protein
LRDLKLISVATWDTGRNRRLVGRTKITVDQLGVIEKATEYPCESLSI